MPVRLRERVRIVRLRAREGRSDLNRAGSGRGERGRENFEKRNRHRIDGRRAPSIDRMFFFLRPSLLPCRFPSSPPQRALPPRREPRARRVERAPVTGKPRDVEKGGRRGTWTGVFFPSFSSMTPSLEEDVSRRRRRKNIESVFLPTPAVFPRARLFFIHPAPSGAPDGSLALLKWLDDGTMSPERAF